MKQIFLNGGKTVFNYDDEEYTYFEIENGGVRKQYRGGKFAFSQVRDVEVIRNNEVVKTGGNGLIGGILFGLPGAVVGSQIGVKTKEQLRVINLRIYLRDCEQAFVDLRVFYIGDHFFPAKAYRESEQECTRIYYIFKDYLEKNKNE